MQVVSSSTTQTIDSYGSVNVPISKVFCTASSASIAYDITISIAGAMVPWLAIDSFTSSIYGSTTSHGSQFTVDVKIDVSGSVQTRSFILNVLECPQSH